MSPREDYFIAEGKVLGIQKGKDEIRILARTDADLVEVWMLEIERWSSPEKPRVILVQYTHHDNLITQDKLDTTVWKFEFSQAPPDQSGACTIWSAAERPFAETTFGAHRKLPDPKTLTCFLMTRRPDPSLPTHSVP